MGDRVMGIALVALGSFVLALKLVVLFPPSPRVSAEPWELFLCLAMIVFGAINAARPD